MTHERPVERVDVRLRRPARHPASRHRGAPGILGRLPDPGLPQPERRPVRMGRYRELRPRPSRARRDRHQLRPPADLPAPRRDAARHRHGRSRGHRSGPGVPAVAGGVEWRRLEVPGLDDLLGAGVYYGAGPSEAVSCRGCRVAVVGGGNSAGQAVVRFSRYASHVTLLVRGSRLGDAMSQYLATRVSQLGNVDIRTGTDVVELEANSRLRAAVLSSTEGTARVRLPIESLFVCIGGVPRTQGLTTLGLAANEAGYLRTGAEVSAESGNESRWSLSRPPLPLETNHPGLFAAGDVRSGSIKRCSAAIGEGSMAVALVHRRLAEVGGE